MSVIRWQPTKQTAKCRYCDGTGEAVERDDVAPCAAAIRKAIHEIGKRYPDVKERRVATVVGRGLERDHLHLPLTTEYIEGIYKRMASDREDRRRKHAKRQTVTDDKVTLY